MNSVNTSHLQQLISSLEIGALTHCTPPAHSQLPEQFQAYNGLDFIYLTSGYTLPVLHWA